MEDFFIERRGDRRRVARPFATERRIREQRTGVEVRAISGESARRGLARALEATGMSPLDRAAFEIAYARSVAEASR